MLKHTSSEIQQIEEALGERFGRLNGGERGHARMLLPNEIQVFSPASEALVTVHTHERGVSVSFSGPMASAARKALLAKRLVGPEVRTTHADRQFYQLIAQPLPPTAQELAIQAFLEKLGAK